jgi:hypothetical protein
MMQSKERHCDRMSKPRRQSASLRSLRLSGKMSLASTIAAKAIEIPAMSGSPSTAAATSPA